MVHQHQTEPFCKLELSKRHLTYVLQWKQTTLCSEAGCDRLTSTLSSLKWVCCASFSLVVTSGYWFCRNSSSSASSCSSVKIVRCRLVLLCAGPGDRSSLWASPGPHGSVSIAGGHAYWQAAGGRSGCGGKHCCQQFETEGTLLALTFLDEISVVNVSTVGAVAAAQAGVMNSLPRASERTPGPLF